jgi:RNA recognition motif-containing protein
MDMYSGVKRAADGVTDFAKRQKTGNPSKVLHVRALPSYTTESELVSVVAPFGQVVKCLLLPDKNQAFIQMASIEAASALLDSLEFTQPQIRSKAIFFQFSSRTEIETKANTGAAGADAGASCTLLITVLNVTVPVTLDNICQICKPYGEVLKIITFPKGADFQALVQMATVEQAVNAKLFLEGKDLFQGCCHLRVNFSKRTNLVVKENSHKSRDFTNPMLGGGMQAYQGMGQMGGMGGMMGGMGGGAGQAGGSPVVLVNKLNEEKTTCDALFMLFGVYGDVLRVKILYNKRDTAMIQFANGQQAYSACQNLGGVTLNGNQIQVNLSKHREIQMPKEQDELSQSLTRDYTGHPAHRFKNKTHVNPKNVNAPSQVLHVSNLHDAATEQELRDLFGAQQPAATTPVVVEFFKNSRKMAYVCMASLDDAITALIGLHSSPLGGYPLRVSFSHKDPTKISNSDAPDAAAATPAAE